MPKAAKQIPETNINLLPSEEPTGSVGKTVTWITTAGRYLIIITEIIALAVFGLSIKLSTDKNDLRDEIKTLSAQVDDQKSFEREFRATTQQISEIRSLTTSHSKTNKMISEFDALFPKGMTLNSLKFEKGKIDFSGEFASPAQLQTLVLSFSKSDKLGGLDISELKSPTEQIHNYTFSASVLVNTAKF